jgi:simple sugar transport system permease protein
VNIGLEGAILMGAFFAAFGADKTNSWILGLLIGILVGMALMAILAVFAVSLRADQIVTGTALNFLAAGITGYLYVDLYGDLGTPTTSRACRASSCRSSPSRSSETRSAG